MAFAFSNIVKKIIIIFLSLLIAVLTVFILIIFNRPPVLIVTDVSFIPLYGEDRAKYELRYSSFTLLRPVKPVMVADDAGADIVLYAVMETSAAPFCVIFPLRFAQAARMYRENNPEIPVVILEGRYPENASPASYAVGNTNFDDYHLYKTDIAADFYRAGLASAVLDGEKNGRAVVFMESGITSIAREAYLKAINESEKTLQTSFYTSFSQYSESSNLSSVVLAGTGYEFLNNSSEIPVIIFSWIDPFLMPANVVAVLNDSPFALAVETARMVEAGVLKGLIQSVPVLLPGVNIDKETLQKLKKIYVNSQ